MVQIKANSPADYIAQLPKDRQGDIEQLVALIQKEAPELKPTMQFGMIGFGPYRYRYASGREGDWAQIAVAAQKNYTSLYVSCADRGKYLAESYKDKLPKANIGKSCIRFKRLADLDTAAVRQLIAQAAELYSPSVDNYAG